MQRPVVRIIIVNYNGGAFLGRCLDAVRAQTFRDFEVVVVDNGSTDGSMDAVMPTDDPRFSRLDLGENTGFAAANNRGAEGARTRWLVALNPDAFAPPDWLETLVAEAEAHPQAQMIGCTLILDASPDRAPLLDGAGDNLAPFGIPWRGGFRQPAIEPYPQGECFAPCAAAALYDREAFEAVGGFDERFFCYCEDVDLAFRLRLRGGRCYQSGRAVVRHVSSGLTGRHSEFSLYHGYRNALWMSVKCMPWPMLPLTVAGHFLACLLLQVRGLVVRRPMPGLKAWLHAVQGLRPAWRERRRVQASRRIGTLELSRAFTWNPLAYLMRRICLKPWR